MRKVSAAFACLLAILCALSCHAHTIRVPDDQPTIQAGVDAASDSDTVLVSPGTYQESVSLLGKAITLRSVGGPATTSIDASGLLHALECTSGETDATVIRGFTVTGAVDDGIMCVGGASPVFRDLVVTGNTSAGATCINSAPLFDGVTFEENEGSGIYASGAAITVDGCAFHWNGLNGIRGKVGSVAYVTDSLFDGGALQGHTSMKSGIYMEFAKLDMHGCTVEHHHGMSALRFLRMESVTIESSHLQDNRAEDGGAVYCEGRWQTDCPVVIRGCTFNENKAFDHGGAVVCRWVASATIEDCVFKGNRSDDYGGAVSFHDAAEATCSGCSFQENLAGDYGGALRSFGEMGCQLSLTDCLFTGNVARLSGSGIHIVITSGIVEHNTFYDCSCVATNGGAIHLGGHPLPEVSRTIVCHCEGKGFRGINLEAVPEISCCDVYDCTAGLYGGEIPDLTGVDNNISADPLFCGPGDFDFSLDASSPCGPGGPCVKHLGAFGVGCGDPVAAEEMSWGAIKAKYR